MKIALHQVPSPAGDLEAGFAALDAGARAAAAAGAALAVFPELYLPGYGVTDPGGDPQGGAWEQRAAAIARDAGVALAYGYAEAADGGLYNSAVVIGPGGERIAHYRKIQLFGPHEERLYRPGGAYSVFDFGGRKAALLICYDVEFAPHLRALALRGVGLVICPTANPFPWVHVPRLTVPAHAINHRMTIAYANYCGRDGAFEFCGGSLIADWDGEVLASAGPGPAILIADLDRPHDPRMRMTQVEDFRPVE
jgi:nitrilase